LRPKNRGANLRYPVATNRIAKTPMARAPMAIWNTQGVTVLLGVVEKSGVTWS
jgi:hypothetical protein